ncbi:unnamed protein product [Musa acuminata subsp. malaccensis]|uniref:(wild Malaysian banana) hypothetical protein n=1 Tax=Musa acuminata subsp. malaccensis TaxID=214687 RepID=A0A804KSZ9_MUSAM|nr:unnamed protein product [Musa acuminata subsp. malaccensis]
MKSLLWHGGSAWDAWFSCASNQVVQVLLTPPYSFSQLGMWGAAPERRSKPSTSRITSSSGSGCLTDCWGCTGKPSASSSSVLLCYNLVEDFLTIRGYLSILLREIL